MDCKATTTLCGTETLGVDFITEVTAKGSRTSEMSTVFNNRFLQMSGGKQSEGGKSQRPWVWLSFFCVLIAWPETSLGVVDSEYIILEMLYSSVLVRFSKTEKEKDTGWLLTGADSRDCGGQQYSKTAGELAFWRLGADAFFTFIPLPA